MASVKTRHLNGGECTFNGPVYTHNGSAYVPLKENEAWALFSGTNKKVPPIFVKKSGRFQTVILDQIYTCKHAYPKRMCFGVECKYSRTPFYVIEGSSFVHLDEAKAWQYYTGNSSTFPDIFKHDNGSYVKVNISELFCRSDQTCARGCVTDCVHQVREVLDKLKKGKENSNKDKSEDKSKEKEQVKEKSKEKSKEKPKGKPKEDNILTTSGLCELECFDFDSDDEESEFPEDCMYYPDSIKENVTTARGFKDFNTKVNVNHEGDNHSAELAMILPREVSVGFTNGRRNKPTPVTVFVYVSRQRSKTKGFFVKKDPLIQRVTSEVIVHPYARIRSAMARTSEGKPMQIKISRVIKDPKATPPDKFLPTEESVYFHAARQLTLGRKCVYTNQAGIDARYVTYGNLAPGVPLQGPPDHISNEFDKANLRDLYDGPNRMTEWCASFMQHPDDELEICADNLAADEDRMDKIYGERTMPAFYESIDTPTFGFDGEYDDTEVGNCEPLSSEVMTYEDGDGDQVPVQGLPTVMNPEAPIFVAPTSQSYAPKLQRQIVRRRPTSYSGSRRLNNSQGKKVLYDRYPEDTDEGITGFPLDLSKGKPPGWCEEHWNVYCKNRAKNDARKANKIAKKEQGNQPSPQQGATGGRPVRDPNTFTQRLTNVNSQGNNSAVQGALDKAIATKQKIQDQKQASQTSQKPQGQKPQIPPKPTLPSTENKFEVLANQPTEPRSYTERCVNGIRSIVSNSVMPLDGDRYEVIQRHGKHYLVEKSEGPRFTERTTPSDVSMYEAIGDVCHSYEQDKGYRDVYPDAKRNVGCVIVNSGTIDTFCDCNKPMILTVRHCFEKDGKVKHDCPSNFIFYKYKGSTQIGFVVYTYDVKDLITLFSHDFEHDQCYHCKQPNRLFQQHTDSVFLPISVAKKRCFTVNLGKVTEVNPHYFTFNPLPLGVVKTGPALAVGLQFKGYEMPVYSKAPLVTATYFSRDTFTTLTSTDGSCASILICEGNVCGILTRGYVVKVRFKGQIIQADDTLRSGFLYLSQTLDGGHSWVQQVGETFNYSLHDGDSKDDVSVSYTLNKGRVTTAQFPVTRQGCTAFLSEFAMLVKVPSGCVDGNVTFIVTAPLLNVKFGNPMSVSYEMTFLSKPDCLLKREIIVRQAIGPEDYGYSDISVDHKSPVECRSLIGERHKLIEFCLPNLGGVVINHVSSPVEFPCKSHHVTTSNLQFMCVSLEGSVKVSHIPYPYSVLLIEFEKRIRPDRIRFWAKGDLIDTPFLVYVRNGKTAGIEDVTDYICRDEDVFYYGTKSQSAFSKNQNCRKVNGKFVWSGNVFATVEKCKPLDGIEDTKDGFPVPVPDVDVLDEASIYDLFYPEFTDEELDPPSDSDVTYPTVDNGTFSDLSLGLNVFDGSFLHHIDDGMYFKPFAQNENDELPDQSGVECPCGCGTNCNWPQDDCVEIVAQETVERGDDDPRIPDYKLPDQYNKQPEYVRRHQLKKLNNQILQKTIRVHKGDQDVIDEARRTYQQRKEDISAMHTYNYYMECNPGHVARKDWKLPLDPSGRTIYPPNYQKPKEANICPTCHQEMPERKKKKKRNRGRRRSRKKSESDSGSDVLVERARTSPSMEHRIFCQCEDCKNDPPTYVCSVGRIISSKHVDYGDDDVIDEQPVPITRYDTIDELNEVIEKSQTERLKDQGVEFDFDPATCKLVPKGQYDVLLYETTITGKMVFTNADQQFHHKCIHCEYSSLKVKYYKTRPPVYHCLRCKGVSGSTKKEHIAFNDGSVVYLDKDNEEEYLSACRTIFHMKIETLSDLKQASQNDNGIEFVLSKLERGDEVSYYDYCKFHRIWPEVDLGIGYRIKNPVFTKMPKVREPHGDYAKCGRKRSPWCPSLCFWIFCFAMFLCPSVALNSTCGKVEEINITSEMINATQCYLCEGYPKYLSKYSNLNSSHVYIGNCYDADAYWLAVAYIYFYGIYEIKRMTLGFNGSILYNSLDYDQNFNLSSGKQVSFRASRLRLSAEKPYLWLHSYLKIEGALCESRVLHKSEGNFYHTNGSVLPKVNDAVYLNSSKWYSSNYAPWAANWYGIISGSGFLGVCAEASKKWNYGGYFSIVAGYYVCGFLFRGYDKDEYPRKVQVDYFNGMNWSSSVFTNPGVFNEAWNVTDGPYYVTKIRFIDRGYIGWSPIYVQPIKCKRVLFGYDFPYIDLSGFKKSQFDISLQSSDDDIKWYRLPYFASGKYPGFVANASVNGKFEIYLLDYYHISSIGLYGNWVNYTANFTVLCCNFTGQFAGFLYSTEYEMNCICDKIIIYDVHAGGEQGSKKFYGDFYLSFKIRGKLYDSVPELKPSVNLSINNSFWYVPSYQLSNYSIIKDQNPFTEVWIPRMPNPTISFDLDGKCVTGFNFTGSADGCFMEIDVWFDNVTIKAFNSCASVLSDTVVVNFPPMCPKRIHVVGTVPRVVGGVMKPALRLGVRVIENVVMSVFPVGPKLLQKWNGLSSTLKVNQTYGNFSCYPNLKGTVLRICGEVKHVSGYASQKCQTCNVSCEYQGKIQSSSLVVYDVPKIGDTDFTHQPNVTSCLSVTRTWRIKDGVVNGHFDFNRSCGVLHWAMLNASNDYAYSVRNFTYNWTCPTVKLISNYSDFRVGWNYSLRCEGDSPSGLYVGDILLSWFPTNAMDARNAYYVPDRCGNVTISCSGYYHDHNFSDRIYGFRYDVPIISSGSFGFRPNVSSCLPLSIRYFVNGSLYLGNFSDFACGNTSILLNATNHFAFSIRHFQIVVPCPIVPYVKLNSTIRAFQIGKIYDLFCDSNVQTSFRICEKNVGNGSMLRYSPSKCDNCSYVCEHKGMYDGFYGIVYDVPRILNENVSMGINNVSVQSCYPYCVKWNSTFGFNSTSESVNIDLQCGIDHTIFLYVFSAYSHSYRKYQVYEECSSPLHPIKMIECSKINCTHPNCFIYQFNDTESISKDYQGLKVIDYVQNVTYQGNCTYQNYTYKSFELLPGPEVCGVMYWLVWSCPKNCTNGGRCVVPDHLHPYVFPKNSTPNEKAAICFERSKLCPGCIYLFNQSDYVPTYLYYKSVLPTNFTFQIMDCYTGVALGFPNSSCCLLQKLIHFPKNCSKYLSCAVPTVITSSVGNSLVLPTSVSEVVMSESVVDESSVVSVDSIFVIKTSMVDLMSSTDNVATSPSVVSFDNTSGVELSGVLFESTASKSSAFDHIMPSSSSVIKTTVDGTSHVVAENTVILSNASISEAVSLMNLSSSAGSSVYLLTSLPSSSFNVNSFAEETVALSSSSSEISVSVSGINVSYLTKSKIHSAISELNYSVNSVFSTSFVIPSSNVMLSTESSQTTTESPYEDVLDPKLLSTMRFIPTSKPPVESDPVFGLHVKFKIDYDVDFGPHFLSSFGINSKHLISFETHPGSTIVELVYNSTYYQEYLSIYELFNNKTFSITFKNVTYGYNSTTLFKEVGVAYRKLNLQNPSFEFQANVTKIGNSQLYDYENCTNCYVILNYRFNSMNYANALYSKASGKKNYEHYDVTVTSPNLTDIFLTIKPDGRDIIVCGLSNFSFNYQSYYNFTLSETCTNETCHTKPNGKWACFDSLAYSGEFTDGIISVPFDDEMSIYYHDSHYHGVKSEWRRIVVIRNDTYEPIIQNCTSARRFTGHDLCGREPCGYDIFHGCDLEEDLEFTVPKKGYVKIRSRRSLNMTMIDDKSPETIICVPDSGECVFKLPQYDSEFHPRKITFIIGGKRKTMTFYSGQCEPYSGNMFDKPREWYCRAPYFYIATTVLLGLVCVAIIAILTPIAKLFSVFTSCADCCFKKCSRIKYSKVAQVPVAIIFCLSLVDMSTAVKIECPALSLCEKESAEVQEWITEMRNRLGEYEDETVLDLASDYVVKRFPNVPRGVLNYCQRCYLHYEFNEVKDIQHVIPSRCRRDGKVCDTLGNIMFSISYPCSYTASRQLDKYSPTNCRAKRLMVIIHIFDVAYNGVNVGLTGFNFYGSTSENQSPIPTLPTFTRPDVQLTGSPSIGPTYGTNPTEYCIRHHPKYIAEYGDGDWGNIKKLSTNYSFYGMKLDGLSAEDFFAFPYIPKYDMSACDFPIFESALSNRTYRPFKLIPVNLDGVTHQLFYKSPEITIYLKLWATQTFIDGKNFYYPSKGGRFSYVSDKMLERSGKIKLFVYHPKLDFGQDAEVTYQNGHYKIKFRNYGYDSIHLEIKWEGFGLLSIMSVKVHEQISLQYHPGNGRWVLIPTRKNLCKRVLTADEASYGNKVSFTYFPCGEEYYEVRDFSFSTKYLDGYIYINNFGNITSKFIITIKKTGHYVDLDCIGNCSVPVPVIVGDNYFIISNGFEKQLIKYYYRGAGLYAAVQYVKEHFLPILLSTIIAGFSVVVFSSLCYRNRLCLFAYLPKKVDAFGFPSSDKITGMFEPFAAYAGMAAVVGAVLLVIILVIVKCKRRIALGAMCAAGPKLALAVSQEVEHNITVVPRHDLPPVKCLDMLCTYMACVAIAFWCVTIITALAYRRPLLDSRILSYCIKKNIMPWKLTIAINFEKYVLVATVLLFWFNIPVGFAYNGRKDCICYYLFQSIGVLVLGVIIWILNLTIPNYRHLLEKAFAKGLYKFDSEYTPSGATSFDTDDPNAEVTIKDRSGKIHTVPKVGKFFKAKLRVGYIKWFICLLLGCNMSCVKPDQTRPHNNNFFFSAKSSALSKDGHLVLYDTINIRVPVQPGRTEFKIFPKTKGLVVHPKTISVQVIANKCRYSTYLHYVFYALKKKIHGKPAFSCVHYNHYKVASIDCPYKGREYSSDFSYNKKDPNKWCRINLEYKYNQRMRSWLRRNCYRAKLVHTIAPDRNKFGTIVTVKPMSRYVRYKICFEKKCKIFEYDSNSIIGKNFDALHVKVGGSLGFHCSLGGMYIWAKSKLYPGVGTPDFGAAKAGAIGDVASRDLKFLKSSDKSHVCPSDFYSARWFYRLQNAWCSSITTTDGYTKFMLSVGVGSIHPIDSTVTSHVISNNHGLDTSTHDEITGFSDLQFQFHGAKFAFIAKDITISNIKIEKKGDTPIIGGEVLQKIIVRYDCNMDGLIYIEVTPPEVTSDLKFECHSLHGSKEMKLLLMKPDTKFCIATQCENMKAIPPKKGVGQDLLLGHAGGNWTSGRESWDTGGALGVGSTGVVLIVALVVAVYCLSSSPKRAGYRNVPEKA